VEALPPRFGEHNAEILQKLGYDSPSIRDLTGTGVLAGEALSKS
jgi:hypothetical protein